MKNRWFSLLKRMAALGCFLSFYPLIALLFGFSAALFSELGRLLVMAYIVLVGYLGYFYGFVTRIKQRKKPVQYNFLFVLSMLVPTACAFLLFKDFNDIFRILVFLLTVTVYAVGRSVYFMDYGTILRDGVFLTNIAANIIALLILWFFKKPYSTPQFVGIFLLIFSIIGLTRNQSNIDYLMERRQHKFENLPRHIRLYNGKLMGVLLGGILLCFLLKDWIVLGLYGLLDVLRVLILLIAKFIFWLGSLFTGGNGENSGALGPSQLPLFPSEEANETLINWPLLLILVAVVTALIYKRKNVFSFFISLFYRVQNWIKNFLHRSYGPHKHPENSEYYYDHEEYLRPEEFALHKSSLNPMRQWNKDYRTFCRMKTSDEKFRFGYGLALRALKIKGIPITPSDTPNEILKKSLMLIDSDFSKDTTKAYNPLRYGSGELLDGGIESLSALLQWASSKNKTYKK